MLIRFVCLDCILESYVNKVIIIIIIIIIVIIIIIIIIVLVLISQLSRDFSYACVHAYRTSGNHG